MLLPFSGLVLQRLDTFRIDVISSLCYSTDLRMLIGVREGFLSSSHASPSSIKVGTRTRDEILTLLFVNTGMGFGSGYHGYNVKGVSHRNRKRKRFRRFPSGYLSTRYPIFKKIFYPTIIQDTPL